MVAYKELLAIVKIVFPQLLEHNLLQHKLIAADKEGTIESVKTKDGETWLQVIKHG